MMVYDSYDKILWWVCAGVCVCIHNFGVNSHLINLCGHDVGVYTSMRELNPLVGIDITHHHSILFLSSTPTIWSWLCWMFGNHIVLISTCQQAGNMTCMKNLSNTGLTVAKNCESVQNMFMVETKWSLADKVTILHITKSQLSLHLVVVVILLR